MIPVSEVFKRKHNVPCKSHQGGPVYPWPRPGMQGLVIDSKLRQYFRNRIIFLCRRARAGLSKKWDFLYYQVTAGKTHRIQKFILYAWKDHSTTIQLYTIPGGDCKIIKSPLPRKVPVRSMDLLCKFKWYFLIVSPGIYFYPP